MAVSKRRLLPVCALVLSMLVAAADARAQTGLAATRNAATTQQQTLANEAANFAHARDVANRVLRGQEFRREGPTSWWDSRKEQLTRAIGRFFSRVGRFAHAAPWLAKALEWTCFGGAALGLLLFILRELRRQRLNVSLARESGAGIAWTREADDWAARATAFARDAQWRDAVHCLYWAAIVLLESQRAWKHNPTRTPREYVRLLRVGSPQHSALSGLTQIFERSWYGQRETTAAEYTEALAQYDGLNTATVIAGARHAAPLQPAQGTQA